jgi:glycosyltransferase involved in cell wall biosynthesis
MEGFGWYSYEIAKRLVENHPEVEFVFFFDRPFDTSFIFGSNVKPVVLFPPARHPLLFVTWFEISLKRALKKHKIDLFFSPDGYISLGAKIPQISVIHDINYEHYPQDVPFSARIYLRKFFPLFAKKAHSIITVSNYSKQDIAKTYSISPDKITVAWNGASDIFKPLIESQKQLIRETYSNGKPYFLFVGAIHPRKNVQRLIEAFIQFKQATSSDIRLVIVGESLWKNSRLTIIIRKNIEDQIHFTGHVTQVKLAEIMGSALAFTYVPYFEGFGIPLVEAMKCGTPILSGNLTSLPEVAGEAAIYCNPFDVKEIAEKMSLLANDEALRKKLSAAGLERNKLFSWDTSAEIVWNEIISVLNK